MQETINEQTAERAAALYRRCENIGTVADGLGIGRERARAALDMAGVEMKMGKGLSVIPPSRGRIVELYVDEGMTATELGNRIGVQHNTVTKWLREEGVELRHKRHVKPPEEELRARHNAGESRASIAEDYGVTPSAVYYWFQDIGISPKPRVDPRLDDAEWLEQKYHDESMSLSAIADETETTDTTVLKKCKKHGIERRPPNGAES